ncbi:hypothetical protein [uncultured Roseibium sp.]|uniref:hypothetical protein n=1 Tax=uncultured Roseibium sp. TaxID=1936171 RepID=UPI00262AD703|nr:hypothetical protein [uncultured Roseibium sp.]
MKQETLQIIAAEANLAPSVHNTQPTRWHLDGIGDLHLSLLPERLLKVGDPNGQDARLSGGAALQGTIYALARQGFGVRGADFEGNSALLKIGSEPKAAPNIETLHRRTTYRGKFAQTTANELKLLKDICAQRKDATLAAGQIIKAEFAELNDSVSLEIMRNAFFRSELLNWMRFSKKDPNWSLDGLSADALEMNAFEATIARYVLRRPVFEALDRMALGKLIISEETKTLSAAGLVAFHRPQEEDRWLSGMHFYSFWISLTNAGFAVWPMAALADDPAANKHVCERLGLPLEDALVTVLRVGRHPGRFQPAKARLSANNLIIKV